MAFADTWNLSFEATPADVEARSLGANRMRQLRKAVRERLEIDHSWAGDADDGMHKKITFVDPLGADPSNVADQGFLYTKNINSVVELFWEDESGNVLQLTSLGGILVSSLGSVLDTNEFAINESEGSDVASAGTTDIWVTDGNTIHVTGTTTITSFDTAPRVGAWRKVIFDGILTLTDGANLNLPGGANIITAADDFAFVYAETATLFKVLYFKASGAPVVAQAVATQTEMEAASAVDKMVTPGRQQFHASAAKAWVVWGPDGTIDASYNITSITDTGTGDWTITVATDFSSVTWCLTGMVEGQNQNDNTQTFFKQGGNKTVTAVRVITINENGALIDGFLMNCAMFGDQ